MNDPLWALKSYMKGIGFSDNVVSVYMSLLQHDHLSVAKLVEITKIQKNEVEDSLHRLLEINAIVSDVIRKKFIYYALNPELVWPAFSKKITWNFIHTLVDADIEASIAQLPDGHRSALGHVRSSVEIIESSAIQLYKSPSFREQHRWRDAADDNQLSRLLAEAMQQSQTSIKAVSKSPRLGQVNLIWQSIRSSISRGVAYQRIADMTEVVEHGLAIVTRDIEEHNIDLRVLDTSEIDQKFYVVDKSLLVVFHQLDSFVDNPAIGRMTNHKEIISRYRRRFDQYYASSVSGLDVIKFLRESGERLIERTHKASFNDVEIQWIQKVIEWGRFCLDPDPFTRKSKDHVHPAVAKNLLQVGTTGHLVPLYDISLHEIRSMLKGDG